MQVNGITWHASVMEQDRFESMRKLVTDTLGVAPLMEMPGVAVFALPDGTLYELYTKETQPPFGYNDGGIAFGFRGTTSRPHRPPSKPPAASSSATSPAPSSATAPTPTATSARPTAASTA